MLILSRYEILVRLWGSHPENTTPNWQSWGPAEVVLCPEKLIQLNQTHPLHLPYMPSFLDPVHHGDAGASIFISSAMFYVQHPFDLYIMDFWIYEVSISMTPCCILDTYENLSVFQWFPLPSQLHPKFSPGFGAVEEVSWEPKGSQWLEQVPLVFAHYHYYVTHLQPNKIIVSKSKTHGAFCLKKTWCFCVAKSGVFQKNFGVWTLMSICSFFYFDGFGIFGRKTSTWSPVPHTFFLGKIYIYINLYLKIYSKDICIYNIDIDHYFISWESKGVLPIKGLWTIIVP